MAYCEGKVKNSLHIHLSTSMKPPTFEAANFWSQLKTAYNDYKNAKIKDDKERMAKLDILIKELEQKLEFQDQGDSYKEAA